MKNHIIISLLILSVGCSTFQKEYDINNITERNGVYVKKLSDEKVNGKVFQMVDDMKVPLGKMKNGKKDGLWTSWYDNGQKKDEFTWKDGKVDGTWKWYWSNGTKMKEGNWKDSKLDGLWTEWDENGQKKEEVIFKDGEMISGKKWNKDGTVKE